MSTLLLRLAGPMQSWGTQSRFSVRDAGTEPSKSGVIGLLCAALGRPRDAALDDLVALRMGVRVERPGSVRREYQTAGGGRGYGVARADGSPGETVLSNRYYLADADFLVGLEGDAALLEELDGALARPRWQLFLGRKSFVPGEPVRLPPRPPWGPGLRAEPLAEALRTYPRFPDPRPGAHEEAARRRLVADIPVGGASPGQLVEVRYDVPLSFAARRFTLRHVTTEWIEPPEAMDHVPVATDPEPA